MSLTLAPELLVPTSVSVCLGFSVNVPVNLTLIDTNRTNEGLSKRLYQYLGGDVDLGNFDADIEWTFLNKEPWWACLVSVIQRDAPILESVN